MTSVCDDCFIDCEQGWMLPTGRTTTLTPDGPELPVVEMVCDDCYRRRSHAR